MAEGGNTVNKYTTDELKISWKLLYWSDANELWKSINLELAKRLTRQEYTQFIAD